MKVPFEFFDANFEVICNMSKQELADRIIFFANKLKSENDDVTNLTHIQDIIEFMANEIDESLVA